MSSHEMISGGPPLLGRSKFPFILIVIGVLLLVQLVTSLSLAPDEAHYWDWSRQLDLSYYSKGPLLAYLIAGATSIFGHTQFAVRIVAILLFAIFLLFFERFLRKQLGESAACHGMLVVCTSPLFLQCGLVTTTDTPAILFWLLALISGYAGVSRRDPRFLVGFFFFVGLGALAKYTLLGLVPGLGLFLICSRDLRRWLASPWMFVGMCVLAVVLSPVILWNMEHGWVNFAHNAGHVSKAGGSFAVKPMYFVELVGGQLGSLGPILFGLLVAVVVLVLRRGSAAGEFSRFLVFSALPLAAMVLVVSFTKRVYVNWPLPIYVSLIPVLIDHANEFEAHLRRSLRLNGVMSVLGILLFVGFTFGVPLKFLFTKRLMGWSEMGEQLSPVLGSPEVIVADDYGVASELALYLPNHPRAYCVLLDDRRMNQYDIWGGWKELMGRDLLLVVKHEENIAGLRQHFKRLIPYAQLPRYQSKWGSRDVREFFLYQGIGYDGFDPGWPEGR